MSVLGAGEAFMLASGEDAGYQIQRSLRFERADDAYLSRNFSAGNRKTWTFSCWAKLSEVGTNRELFCTQGANPWITIQIANNDKFYVSWTAGTSGTPWQSDAVFRDPSAWYHFVVAWDTTQSTAANRLKVWANGVQLTGNNSYPSVNTDYQVNSAVAHGVGGNKDELSGYLAEVHFIDGQALAPTDFGEFDADTGVWNPIQFGGSYGTAEQDGTSSPYVYTNFDTTPNQENNVLYLNSNPDSSSYPLIQSSASTNNTIRVKFASAQTGVTSIKFRGGGYSASSTYNLFVNETQIGGTHNTNSGWGEDSHTISSTDITEIKIVGSDGFAIGQLKFNNTLVPGTPSYGTSATGLNSFHLDFSDNSSNAALGDDRSRPDYNKLSGALTTTSGGGNFYSGPASRAFDGSTSSDVKGGWLAVGDTSNLIWAPPTGSYSVSSSLRVYAGYYSNISVNGVSKATGGHNSAAAWITLNHTGAINEIKFENATNDNVVRISAIEIDGTVLVSNAWTVNNLSVAAGSGNDSLLDSPTNYDDGTNIGGNYCTLNPLHHLHAATLANGNLQTTSSEKAFSTFLLKTGKWYVEHKIDNKGYNLCFSQIDHPSGNTPSSTDSKSIGWYILNGYVYWGAGSSASLGGTTMTGLDSSGYMSNAAIGDVIAAAIDMGNSTIKFYKNGSEVGSIDFSTGTAHRFTEGMYISQFNGYGHWNFGARPFAHTPPAGYKSLCTQNLDEPLIEKPSVYFDVLKYDGATQNPRTVTGLDIADPDLVWVKNRNQTSAQLWWDSIRGTDKNIRSDTNPNYTEAAVSASANGIISTSAANGFVVKNGSGSGSNVGSSGTDPYFAWAWEGGDLATNSAYNQSQAWSTFGDSNAKTNENWTHVFDGNGTAAPHVVANSGSTTVWTPSTPITFTKLEIYANNDGYGDITLNGSISTTGTVPSGGGSSIGWANVTSLISNNTLTSIEVPNSYNSDPTRLGAIKVDDKYLIDPGVIPVGSLNSTVYDRSKAWTSLVTTSSLHNSYNAYGSTSKLGAFDGKQNTSMYSASGPLTITFDSSAFPASGGPYFVEVETNQRGIKVNGQPSSGYTTDIAANQATYWANNGSVSALTSIEINQANHVYGGMTSRIRVNGKVLADRVYDDVTWSDALTPLSNSSLTNPPNGFDGDESTYADSTNGFTLDLSGHTFGTGAHTIEVKSGGATSFIVNGSTSLSTTGSGGAIVWTGTYTGELTSLASSASGASVYYVKIDGSYLLNPGNDFVANFPAIASTNRISTTSGFSIAGWNASGNNQDSVYHGLGAVPDLYIFKSRESTGNWLVYTQAIDGSLDYIYLNNTGQKNNSSANTPTSSFVHVYGSDTNTSGEDMIGYFFKSVEGFSAFGSYTAQSAPHHIYTGFRPALVICKRTNGNGEGWLMTQATMQDYNSFGPYLGAHSTDVENTTSGYMDLVSNGFVHRHDQGWNNATGGTYIYLAWAESPFRNARAR